MSCPETRKWPNMKKDVANKKVLSCKNNAVVTDIGRYLDKLKCD